MLTQQHLRFEIPPCASPPGLIPWWSELQVLHHPSQADQIYQLLGVVVLLGSFWILSWVDGALGGRVHPALGGRAHHALGSVQSEPRKNYFDLKKPVLSLRLVTFCFSLNLKLLYHN